MSPSSRRAWIEIGCASISSRCSLVALLAEGVDRNTSGITGAGRPSGSPSSRRAWIEIWYYSFLKSVVVSPSSRRAWIEMVQIRAALTQQDVALLAEGVDRNNIAGKIG